MIFVGIDWAEAHHDVCLVDEAGQVLARRRVAEGLEGVGKLHALIAEYSEEPTSVAVGIETDRGLLVGSLVAAGYQVFAHKSDGGESIPRPSRDLRCEVRSGRRSGAGRSGSHRPSPTPTGGGRL